MLRLLIADDEVIERKVLYKTLQKNIGDQCVIFQAENGRQALEQLESVLPDVVITDICMPFVDGLELARNIYEKFPDTIVVVLTGFSEFSYAQQAIRMGAVDYLLKPCRSSEILTKLESVAAPWMAEKVETPAGEGNLLVRTAMEYMMDHMSEDINLTMVAEKAGVSTAYLSTLFTQKVGCGFVDYLNKLRIDCACDYMHDGRLKVYEIAFKVGYHDEKYFSKVFKKITGQSPSTYRRNIGIGE